MANAAQLGDRSLFPTLAPRAYLAHAAVSPPSTAVRDAVGRVIEAYGVGGVDAYMQWHDQRERLRATLALLVGASPEEIALTSSTSRAVADVAVCFPWQAGDRVVLFDGEFPANVVPWLRAAERFDLSTSFVPLSDFARSHEEGLASLRVELERGARLVAVSAVQFQTGLRMPVAAMAELCHAHGAELFVDAIQAVGAVPINVSTDAVDYMAVGSHKWLMGLEGCGFLFIRRDRLKALRPVVAGWRSFGAEGARFLFEGPGHLRYDLPVTETAAFVEGGASNVAGLAALEASVNLIAGLGVPAIFGHVNAYLDRLEPALVERGFDSARTSDPAGRSCSLCLRPPEGVSVVGMDRALLAEGVLASIPDGYLRMAPHWPNHVDEIPQVLAALDRVCHKS